MNILVTAGNTLVPIDQVRCITNIFTGRTGTGIALHAHERGHCVTLLTSHPEVVRELRPQGSPSGERWSVCPYRTFEDLEELLKSRITQGGLNVVIHSAAVSDYRAEGIYAPAAKTRFRLNDGRWESADVAGPTLEDRTAGKVKSDENELWLRLVRTPKLVDLIRPAWGFRGVLVKFKLEVGVKEDQLLKLAEKSRRQSDADFMVANTLEGSQEWAFLGAGEGGYARVTRGELAERLLTLVEQKHRERGHG